MIVFIVLKFVLRSLVLGVDVILIKSDKNRWFREFWDE